MTFADFCELVKARVRAMDATFTHPDATWPGVLFAEDDAGQVAVALLVGSAGFSEQAKRTLATVTLPERIKTTGSCRVCWLMPSWLERDGSRDELLALIFIDADHCEAAFARVSRRPRRPPRLGPWLASPTQAPLREVSGLFVDPLVAALREQP